MEGGYSTCQYCNKEKVRYLHLLVTGEIKSVHFGRIKIVGKSGSGRAAEGKVDHNCRSS